MENYRHIKKKIINPKKIMANLKEMKSFDPGMILNPHSPGGLFLKLLLHGKINRPFNLALMSLIFLLVNGLELKVIDQMNFIRL